jgi:hypothetical protein
VADRDAASKPIRTQFADGTVTRGKKFEGVWSNGRGAYIVNSFAFGANDLPADATKHDGMVWFYNYKTETIQLVTYFPDNAAADLGPDAKYDDYNFDSPDNVTVTPWGTLVLAEDGVRASHDLLLVPGEAVAQQQQDAVRQIGPVGHATCHALPGRAQIPRRLGGGGRLHCESVTAEGYDHHAGSARPRGRDLTCGRAADQRHLTRPCPDPSDELPEVIGRRAEHQQQLRVVVPKRLVDRVRHGPLVVGGTDPEPTSRPRETAGDIDLTTLQAPSSLLNEGKPRPGGRRRSASFGPGSRSSRSASADPDGQAPLDGESPIASPGRHVSALRCLTMRVPVTSSRLGIRRTTRRASARRSR